MVCLLFVVVGMCGCVAVMLLGVVLCMLSILSVLLFGWSVVLVRRLRMFLYGLLCSCANVGAVYQLVYLATLRHYNACLARLLFLQVLCVSLCLGCCGYAEHKA